MGIFSLSGKRLEYVKQSAISNHPVQSYFAIHIDDLDILAGDSNKFKLLLRKSLLIKRHKTNLNRRIKSLPLELFDQDHFYYPIIVRQWQSSSNVNDIIRAVLNLFIIFYVKILHAQQAEKAQNHKNANKRISDFFPLRCFLSEKKRYLFVFVRLYAFCALLCL